MKQYGIFIEPTGPLRQAVVSLKEQVERQLPGQKYCSHPPHCTVLVGQYEDPGKWRASLATEMASISPFKIETDSFTFFFDDALADGGHTLAFKIRSIPELFALQKRTAAIVKKWRRAETTAERAKPLDREPFRSSQAEFGFPFVGPHWIAHFTIASLKVAKNSPLLGELSSGDARFSFVLDRISVWEIEGGHHTRMFELPFAGG